MALYINNKELKTIESLLNAKINRSTVDKLYQLLENVEIYMSAAKEKKAKLTILDNRGHVYIYTGEDNPINKMEIDTDFVHVSSKGLSIEEIPPFPYQIIPTRNQYYNLKHKNGTIYTISLRRTNS